MDRHPIIGDNRLFIDFWRRDLVDCCGVINLVERIGRYFWGVYGCRRHIGFSDLGFAMARLSVLWK